MNENWSGSPNGHGDDDLDQKWAFPQQEYQQSLNEAATWNKNQFHQSDAHDGFGGFQGNFQYNGQGSQGDLQYDGQDCQDDVKCDHQGGQEYLAVEGPACEGDDAYDGEENREYPQVNSGGRANAEYDDPASEEISAKDEVDRMISDGVFKGLIPTPEVFYGESRVENELRELKRAGAMGPGLGAVQLQYWVGRLFLAFKNVENTHDNKCKNGKPAQAVQRLGSSYYPDEAIEAACWRIVLDCNKAQYGIRLVEPHHGSKMEDYETFEQRMEMVIRVCKHSKAICKQLLDPPFHHRLVDAPDAELGVKANNKKLNHKRDIQNAIGRQTMKEKNIKIADLTDLPDIPSDLDEGFDSEKDDADNTYYTTPGSSKSKHTPASKRHSGRSFRTPSKKLVIKAEPESTPLSLKRKRRTISAQKKNYNVDSDDGEDDTDVSEYKDEAESGKPSSKRFASNSSRVLEMSPTPAARAVLRKQLSEMPLPSTIPVRAQPEDVPGSASHDQVHAPGPVSSYQPLDSSSSRSYGQVQESPSSRFYSLPQGSSSSAFAHTQSAFGSTSVQVQGSASSSSAFAQPQAFSSATAIAPGGVVLPYDIPDEAADNQVDGIMEYKLILCELLQVPEHLSTRYTLEELRTYARAYNFQFANEIWVGKGPDGRNWVLKTFRVEKPRLPHFCHVVIKLAYLAVCRGDLNANATYNPKSKHMKGFLTNGDLRLDKALGVIPNPFGIDRHYISIFLTFFPQFRKPPGQKPSEEKPTEEKASGNEAKVEPN